MLLMRGKEPLSKASPSFDSRFKCSVAVLNELSVLPSGPDVNAFITALGTCTDADDAPGNPSLIAVAPETYIVPPGLLGSATCTGRPIPGLPRLSGVVFPVALLTRDAPAAPCTVVVCCEFDRSIPLRSLSFWREPTSCAACGPNSPESAISCVIVAVPICPPPPL